MLKTEHHGTRTLQGWIPHLRWLTPYGTLLCPVRVKVARRDMDILPSLYYDREGNLRHVLPGGSDVTAPCNGDARQLA